MKLKAYNKYWNRWDEVYDFPFLRKNYEYIYIKNGEEWSYVQIANYSRFEREEVKIDSFRQIVKDVRYVCFCLVTCLIRFIMMDMYHPLTKIRKNFAD